MLKIFSKCSQLGSLPKDSLANTPAPQEQSLILSPVKDFPGEQDSKDGQSVIF